MSVKFLSLKNPNLSLEWHPTLNGSLLPSMVTYGSVKKVWWQCKLGHEWEARIDHRHRGTGCPYCSGKLILAKFNSFAAFNPKAMEEWDYERNQAFDPTQIPASFNKQVWWVCKSYQHEWQTTPKARNEGYGCHVCSGVKVEEGYNDLLTTHAHLIDEWDFDRNINIAQTHEVSYGSQKKVYWNCTKCKYNWLASIAHRTSGKGCPKCSQGKTERMFVDELTKQSGYEFRSSFVQAPRRLFKRNRIQVDGLCEELKMAFEYDGEWTHGKNNPQGKSYQQRLDEDADTTEALLNAGYSVIRVREEPLDFVVVDSNKLKNTETKSILSQYSYKLNRDKIEDLVKYILGS